MKQVTVKLNEYFRESRNAFIGKSIDALEKSQTSEDGTQTFKLVRKGLAKTRKFVKIAGQQMTHRTEFAQTAKAVKKKKVLNSMSA